ncbi:MAG: NAD-dependent epimerase/dehydratase family protein [Caulobacterales bacterium]
MTKPLVAVTGASGFLGRQLVPALSAEGFSIRALIRRDPVHPLWRGLEPEIVIGDLETDDSLERLCDGAVAVVHGAALIKAKSRRHFDAINTLGAERVARAADRGGASRMVLISSLAAREPHLSDYAHSKRQAENAVRAVMGERLCVVRPPALYGPGDRETLQLFQAASRSPIVPVFSPAARIALMHVQDAARQIAFLTAASAHRSHATLSDDRPGGYNWLEIVQSASRAVGKAPKVTPLPGAVLTVAGLAGSVSRLFGAAPILTIGKSRELRHLDWSVRPEEQCFDLPKPFFPLNDGLAETAAWYIKAGWLRAPSA